MNREGTEEVQQTLMKLAHVASQIEARSADAMRRVDAKRNGPPTRWPSSAGC